MNTIKELSDRNDSRLSESSEPEPSVKIILSQVKPRLSHNEKAFIKTVVCLTEPEFPAKTFTEIQDILQSATEKAEELKVESLYREVPIYQDALKLWKEHLDGFTGVLKDVFVFKVTGEEEQFIKSFSYLGKMTRAFLQFRTQVDCAKGKISVFKNESEANQNP